MAGGPEPVRTPALFAAKVAVGVFIAANVFAIIAISVHLNALIAAIVAGSVLFVTLITWGFRERRRIAADRDEN